MKTPPGSVAHDVAGGCHCGAIRFTAVIRDWTALRCNCSICRHKQFLHAIVAAEDFRLVSGADGLTRYRFGTGVAEHLFCATCGVQSFYRPRSHPDAFDINVHCLDDAEVRGRFESRPFDGEHWESAIATLRESP